MYKIVIEKCSACGLCADVCPVEAISQFGRFIISSDKCVSCGQCKEDCPSQAVIETE